MFANEYFSKAISLLQKIQTTQNDAIIAGAKAMADSIAAGRAGLSGDSQSSCGLAGQPLIRCWRA